MPKRKRNASVTTEDNGYFSDESEFYGNSTTKQELETRAINFSPQEWWNHKLPSLMEISALNLETTKEKETAKLYNPYAGLSYARQLSETVDEFLARLPPASTPVSDMIPWIFIANPYRKTKQPGGASQSNGIDPGTEGPPAEESDLPAFSRVASGLLDELFDLREGIEAKNSGKAKGTITKMLNTQRDRIVKSILDTAVKYKYTTGKWMIFATFEEVNIVWAAIAKATANHELGIAAKVAPDEGNPRKERLICIYTHDFTDVEDITRVAKKLKEIGVLDTRGRGIFYKCDAYTELGLNSTNPYAIKVSLYNSNDILQGKNAKIDGFFYKKKKELGDWKASERE